MLNFTLNNGNIKMFIQFEAVSGSSLINKDKNFRYSTVQSET